MFSAQQPSGITSYRCLPPAPSCFSLKPCLYAVRKMVQYGGKKAGHLVHQICIWPQHMANPGHLTIVLIRMCRQTGCCAFAVSVSFFSQRATQCSSSGHSRLSSANHSLHPFHLRLLKFPPPLCLLSVGWWPSNSQACPTPPIPLKTFDTPRSQQKVTTAAQGLFRG